MTNEEKQEIIEAVLEALQTNSMSISQLTSVTELVDGDLIEIAGGKRITFANLIKNVMAGGVVNDLTTGGEGDALSAEMGKKVRQNVTILLNRLGEYAFPNGKPTLDWSGGDDPEVPTYSVQKTIGTGLSASGGGTDVNEGDSLEVAIAITDNLYVVDDDSVVVTMGGQPVVGAWNASTMKVSIAAVTGDVVINVPSMTYEPTNLAFQLDCMNGVTKSGSTPTKWTDLVGNKEFVLTNVTEAQGGGMSFDGSSSTAVYNGGSLAVGYKTGTIEFVIGSEVAITGRVTMLFNGYNKGINAIGINVSDTAGITSCYSDDANIADALRLMRSNVPVAAALNINNGGSRSCIVNGIVDNNVEFSSNFFNAGTGGALGKMAVGCFLKATDGTPDMDRLFVITIKAVRVYSQQLTLAQAQQNYKVDKKRFNLA